MKQLSFDQEDYILEEGLEKKRCGVQGTSLEAFDLIFDELGSRQKEVYEVIESYCNCCNQDIAEFLGLPINSVTPRVKELRDLGFVCQNGFKINRLGRRVMTWKVK